MKNYLTELACNDALRAELLIDVGSQIFSSINLKEGQLPEQLLRTAEDQRINKMGTNQKGRGVMSVMASCDGWAPFRCQS